MTSHELARMLLAGPDLPIVSGLDRSDYAEPVADYQVLEVYPLDEHGQTGDKAERVVDLLLSNISSHSYRQANKPTPTEEAACAWRRLNEQE